MDLELKGKVAIVGGASKGLGRACAQALAEEGCKLTLCSRSQADLDKAAGEIRAATGADVLVVAGDLDRYDTIRSLVSSAVKQFGRLDILVNNSGGPPLAQAHDATEEQWATAVKHLKTLGDYAGKLGLQIALELEPFHLSLLNSVDAMVRFIDECDQPAVRANIDISHLVLAKIPPQELRRLKGKAAHVHISDCDGRVHGDLPPGRGVVPFAPYLKEIKDLGIDGTISIELEYSPQPEMIVDWVKEAYRETDKLLQEAGLRDPR